MPSDTDTAEEEEEEEGHEGSGSNRNLLASQLASEEGSASTLALPISNDSRTDRPRNNACRLSRIVLHRNGMYVLDGMRNEEQQEHQYNTIEHMNGGRRGEPDRMRVRRCARHGQ